MQKPRHTAPALLPQMATEPFLALGPTQNLQCTWYYKWLKAAYVYVSMCHLPNPKKPIKLHASLFSERLHVDDNYTNNNNKTIVLDFLGQFIRKTAD